MTNPDSIDHSYERLGEVTREICHAETTGEPLEISNISEPGVYRMKRFESSAALVVTSEGDKFLVNDKWISPYNGSQTSTAVVWETLMEVPDDFRELHQESQNRQEELANQIG